MGRCGKTDECSENTRREPVVGEPVVREAILYEDLYSKIFRRRKFLNHYLELQVVIFSKLQIRLRKVHAPFWSRHLVRISRSRSCVETGSMASLLSLMHSWRPAKRIAMCLLRELKFALLARCRAPLLSQKMVASDSLAHPSSIMTFER